MNHKKFIVTNVNTYFGWKVMLLSKDDYGVTLSETKIMFESDDFNEAFNYYQSAKNNSTSN